VQRYREELNQPGLKIQYNARRGYFLSIAGRTPISGAVQSVIQGKRCVFSTEVSEEVVEKISPSLLNNNQQPLIGLNERQKESLNEILVLTER
jgi:hypothetical protein